jgi:acyl dehydratase
VTAGTTSKNIRFDQLTVGDRLPELVRGPLTPVHLVRWSAASENWHRIHYDLPFATEHDGLPGLLINGSFKQHLVVQMLREWAEPAGWLFSVSFQFRKMDVAPDTLTVWGVITGLRKENGLGYVDLEIGIRNGAGEESTPGTAVVVLPLDPGTPVPYPFPYPEP